MGNEITVKVKGNINELYKNLEKQEFKIIDTFRLDDTYFIPKNLEIEKLTTREILTQAVIVREVIGTNPKRIIKVLLFKRKEFDEKGNILKQEKSECDVLEIEDAKNFMKAIGYKEIMRIIENDIAYGKNGFDLAIKNIENGDRLIESEILEDNQELNTIEKVKNKIEELGINIYTDNFFVKKAEIELNKRLGRKGKENV